MSLIWLATWFISNLTGAHEPLPLDPVNAWAGTLILAVALDIGLQRAPDNR